MEILLKEPHVYLENIGPQNWRWCCLLNNYWWHVPQDQDLWHASKF
jgi:hypothetical protein